MKAIALHPSHAAYHDVAWLSMHALVVIGRGGLRGLHAALLAGLPSVICATTVTHLGGALTSPHEYIYRHYATLYEKILQYSLGLLPSFCTVDFYSID